MEEDREWKPVPVKVEPGLAHNGGDEEYYTGSQRVLADKSQDVDDQTSDLTGRSSSESTHLTFENFSRVCEFASDFIRDPYLNNRGLLSLSDNFLGGNVNKKLNDECCERSNDISSFSQSEPASQKSQVLDGSPIVSPEKIKINPGNNVLEGNQIREPENHTLNFNYAPNEMKVEVISEENLNTKAYFETKEALLCRIPTLNLVADIKTIKNDFSEWQNDGATPLAFQQCSSSFASECNSEYTSLNHSAEEFCHHGNSGDGKSNSAVDHLATLSDKMYLGESCLDQLKVEAEFIDYSTLSLNTSSTSEVFSNNLEGGEVASTSAKQVESRVTDKRGVLSPQSEGCPNQSHELTVGELISSHSESAFSQDRYLAKPGTKAALKTNSPSHIKKKLFPCGQCSAHLSSEKGLAQHVLNHSAQKSLSCEKFSAHFEDAEGLKRHLPIHTAKVSFTCEKCPAHFKDEGGSKRHLPIHTVKSFTCEKCSAQFKDEEGLKRHLPIHTVKSFTCKKCPARFLNEEGLTRHILTHTENKYFTCKQCPAHFKDKGLLTRHMQYHPKIEPFTCKVCSEYFENKGLFAQHLLQKHYGKSISCGHCPLQCNSKLELKLHLQCNHREPFPCDKCSASFITEKVLKLHLSVCHEGASCKECPAQFESREALEKHSSIHSFHAVSQAGIEPETVRKGQPLTHTKKKYFSCKQCLVTFETETMLARHLLAFEFKHLYACEHCSAQFKFKRDLRQHLKKHCRGPSTRCHFSALSKSKRSQEVSLPRHSTWEPYVCHHCKAQFKSKGDLKLHFPIHAAEKPPTKLKSPTPVPTLRLICDKCPANFLSIVELNQHMRSHTTKRLFSCGYCSEYHATRESIKRHLLTHEEESVSCGDCSARFKSREEFALHLITHTYPDSNQSRQCKARSRSERHLESHKYYLRPKRKTQRSARAQMSR